MNLDKFTERSRGFVQAAQTIAMRENHQRLTPEHILKALMDDEEGLSANLITKADFGHALQGLVERGKLTEMERKIVIECCEHDKCFLESGKYVGYVDFDDDFLRHYIPVDERSVRTGY